MLVTNITSDSTGQNTLYDILLNSGENVFFTSITRNNNFIECIDGETTPLRLSFYGANIIWDSTHDGAQVYGTIINANYVRIKQVIRTSHGIILMIGPNVANDVCDAGIIITKDNDGDTAIIFRKYGNDGMAVTTSFWTASKKYPYSGERAAAVQTNSDLLTAGVPIVLNGAMNYTPDCLMLTQRQYSVKGEIILGTTHYWSDGQIALKDT